MNLFLLFAVPLAAVAAHSLLAPKRAPFADPKGWILGAVLSVASLVTASFLGRLREFTGDLVGSLAGLALTDVILVPGLVVASWLLLRRRQPVWELGLWLALVFTMAGLRDFVSTNQTYDLNELFLVPLGRILVMAALPALVAEALNAPRGRERWIWISGAALLPLLTGAVFPVFSFAGWGLASWILLAGGLTAALWLQIRTASPEGSGRLP